MEAVDLLGLLVIGFFGGMLGGLVGVGGGVLFVPGLVIFLGESQLEAEGTSLLAIVLVAAVGAARQGGYGNLRLRDGLVVGVLSPIGVGAGTVLANNLSERALELSFAALQLYFAYGLARRALRSPDPREAANG
jgi:uncharacterized membrane protein YfcA